MESKRTDALQLIGIDKSFPGVHALKQVDFSLPEGEVRGLVGENGAGKSTLMNILGGVLQPDAGRVVIGGRFVTLENPAKAERKGIAFIHQELSLFENLDVATNIFIHNLPRRGGLLDNRKLYGETREILRRVGLPQIRPGELVANLRLGQRQLVEIARCLTQKVKILILDEPTSSLTSQETERLFEIVTSLKNEGVSVIFISHRLDEIFRICGSITVMRDGRNIKTSEIAEIGLPDVVRLMIGREMSEMYAHERRASGGKTLLEVRNLSRSGKFSNVSFTLREGESLGLYGLMGSGRTELVRAIFGLDHYDAGEILVSGKPVHIRSPQDAIRCGVSLITENRRREGLDLIHSVQSNLLLASIDRFKRAFSLLDRQRERTVCQENIAKFGIKTPSLQQIAKNLSGGNQQKVVIAKWINTKPKVLILDEPTRGIDVGAKKEIFGIIDDLLSSGVGIFLISSELAEINGLCDRLLIIRKGRIVSEHGIEARSEERILSEAMGV